MFKHISFLKQFFSIICSFAYSVFNEHLIPRVYSRELVGLDGLEPSTSRLSGARSNHLSYRPVLSGIALRVFGSYSSSPTGGDDGIRTHDPLLAGQVLSQLSYTPIGVTLVSRVVQFLSKTILFDSP